MSCQISTQLHVAPRLPSVKLSLDSADQHFSTHLVFTIILCVLQISLAMSCSRQMTVNIYPRLISSFTVFSVLRCRLSFVNKQLSTDVLYDRPKVVDM